MVAPVLGFDPTQTESTLSAMGGFALGTTTFDHKGRAFTLVQADGALAQYAACGIPEDFDAIELDDTNAAANGAIGEAAPVGVAMVAVTDNYYAWLARFGTGTDIKVLAASTCSAGTELTVTSTDGTLDDVATGVPVVGLKTIEDITASGSVQVTLNWPVTGNTLA